MELPPHGYFFSPYSRVLLELTRLQYPQHAASPHLFMDIKIVYLIVTLDHLSFKCLVLIALKALTVTTLTDRLTHRS